MFPLRVKKFEIVEYTLIFFFLPKVTRKKINNKKNLNKKILPTIGKWFRPEKKKKKKKIGISKIKIRKIKS